jgi:hypothetical protein
LAGGQDHLALQAISINFYGKLLPGLTNLTQRVRYFSIYPWVLSNYVKRVGKNDRKQWRQFIRRAEFLYSLMSVTNSDEYNIPGSRTATAVLNSGKSKIKFAKYSDYESPQKYWQYSFGAYGQYYLGSLRYLDIIFSPDKNEIDYLGENGKLLSNSLDEIIPKNIAQTFFDCVEKAEVDYSELEKLYPELSPSSIDPRGEESKLLLDILFNYKPNEIDRNRIDSLKMLLGFLENYSDSEVDIREIQFSLLYNRYYDKTSLQLTSSDAIKNYWNAFTIGELIHFSLESLFWCFLNIVENEEGNFIEYNFENLLNLLSDAISKQRIITKTDLKRKKFGECVSKISTYFSESKNDWYDKEKNSLYNIYLQIGESIKAVELQKVGLYSLALLSKLIKKYSDSDELKSVYGLTGIMGRDFPNYNAYTIITDNKLINAANFKDGVYYLLKKNIVNRHIKVATEKLRFERINTFRFELRDGRTYLINDFEPSLTNPRLHSAINFIDDLGLYSFEKNKITSVGKKYLK